METRVKPRKVPPQNIVLRLFNRQTFGYKKPATYFQTARQFYQNVFPNFTVINVEKPPCFLRKFSPDGKHLIAFSADQTSLEVYMYNGAAAANDLLQNINLHVPNRDSDKNNFEIKSHMFERFFTLKFVISVSQAPEQLNRECSLFTEDGRYVIIGSAAYIPEELRPHFYDIYTNNESVTPNPRSPLENYTLYLVDLELEKLCDTLQFEVDKIFLSHNQGLYLYKDILAVLSVQHQVIHVYQLLDGIFVAVRDVGRFCFEDDSFFFNSVFPMERPFRENCINSLKHRILTFLYKRALHLRETTNNSYEIRKFYNYFESFRALKMWKMQLLDESHLLIKYASEDVVTLKTTDANSQTSIFVVYNMVESKVLAIFENTSKELLEIFENFCDYFRNTSVYTNTQFSCSPSNNLYARLIQHRFMQTIISAKYGGYTEATKRVLAQLPISAQSYSSSPYLDLTLFSFDDKWVSAMERPKPCGEHPIRFYARDSGYLKFKIFAGMTEKTYPAARQLVAFTFHPTDPFAISVQRTNSEYIVNFHVRLDLADLDATGDDNVLNFL